MKRFIPPPFDEQKHAKAIETMAGELAMAKAVDEATGDAVDKFVDAVIAVSIAKTRGAFADYLARLNVHGRRNRLPARVKALGLRVAHHLSRLDDLRAAMKAARDQLDGEGHGGSFASTAQMASRPLSYWVHIPVLLIAAAADVAAFRQVIGLLFDESELPSYLLVAGLTVSVLYLAHVAGAQLRVRRANATWAGIVYPISCLAVVLSVGVVAFYVRLTATKPLDSQAGFTGPDMPGTSSVVESGHTVAGAVLFLALFVASGLVALSGAYLTHNPLRAEYAAAVRGHRWVTWRASRVLRRWAQALEDLAQHEAARSRAEEALNEIINARLAFAVVLKERARLIIAVRMSDPVLTDAYIRNTRGLPPAQEAL